MVLEVSEQQPVSTILSCARASADVSSIVSLSNDCYSVFMWPCCVNIAYLKVTIFCGY